MAKNKKPGSERPKPSWLFRSAEEARILKSKVKVRKDATERLTAVAYLENELARVPPTQPPSIKLLNSIDAFLEEYGFTTTARILRVEREARNKAFGWDDQAGDTHPKETESLVDLFQHSQSGQKAKGRGKDASKAAELSKANIASDSDSDSGSDSSDSSDSDSSDSEMMAKPVEVKNSKKRKVVAAAAPSESSSDSDSDSSSSSSDESSAPTKKRKVESKGKVTKKTTTVKQANGVQSTETTVKTPGKVEKTKVVKPVEVSSDDSSSDNDDSDSSSSASAEIVKKTNGVKPGPGDQLNVSDSSNTLGEAGIDSSSDSGSSSDSSDSDDDAEAATKTIVAAVVSKRKRSDSPLAESKVSTTAKVLKKSNEPFSRIPKDQYVDPKLASNKFVPYDYAQKAHEDLIITKGKGFTKEKNKKKRGSYRGGTIDLGGGKGIRFED